MRSSWESSDLLSRSENETENKTLLYERDNGLGCIPLPFKAKLNVLCWWRQWDKTLYFSMLLSLLLRLFIKPGTYVTMGPGLPWQLNCFFHPIIPSQENCSKVMSGTVFIIFIAIKLITCYVQPRFCLSLADSYTAYWSKRNHVSRGLWIQVKSSNISIFLNYFNTSYNKFKEISRKGKSMEVSDSRMNLIKHKLYQWQWK